MFKFGLKPMKFYYHLNGLKPAPIERTKSIMVFDNRIIQK